MKRLLTCLFFTAVTAASSVASAQWTQPAGEAYAKVSGTILAGNRAFDAEGEVVDVSDYMDLSLNLYGELGFTEYLTVFVASRPVGFAVYDSLDEGYAGMTTLGGRFALLRGDIASSVEFFAGGNPWAIGDITGSDQLTYDPAFRSSVGGWSLRLGTAFGRYWASVAGGFTWWGAEEISSAFMGGAQFGAKLPAGVVVEVHMSMREPFAEVTEFNVAGGGETRYLGVGLGASWWFTDWMSVTASADSAIYAESNAATLPLQLGLEFKF